MSEKIMVIYDPSVYRTLKNQARFNRGVKLFAVMVGLYILNEEIRKRRTTNREGE